MLYSRFLPHLTEQPDSPAYFKLSTCTLKDLPTLHGWLNDPRVDQFWQEKGTLEQHRQFIEERTADPHVLPVIGSYVNLRDQGETPEEQAVYAEIYWVKVYDFGRLCLFCRGCSDCRLCAGGPARTPHAGWNRARLRSRSVASSTRLFAPFLKTDSLAGLHMLVGSDAHRGPHRIRAWMPSLAHYCFLDDPRTQRVICEPNEKNDKIIKVSRASTALARTRADMHLTTVHGVCGLQASRIRPVPAQDGCAHDPRQERLLRVVSVLRFLGFAVVACGMPYLVENIPVSLLI